MRILAKRYSLASLLLIVFLFGCESDVTIPEGFFPYDKAEVHALVEELSFQPSFPAFLPMEAAFFISDRYTDIETDNEAMDISFYTESNDLLSVQAVNGDVNHTYTQVETTIINDNIKGEYVNNSYAQMLFWQKDGISYKLTFRSSTVNDEQRDDNNITVSKDDLIKMADSFHS